MQILEQLIRTLGMMAWETFWALALGFILSSLIQTFVSKQRISSGLGKNNPFSTGLATILGAVSSSCSFAAASIGRSLFSKGATLSNAVAFMVASTNLVFEIFIIILALMGWPFVVGELVGGLFFIGLASLGITYLVPKRVIDEARAHSARQDLKATGCSAHQPQEEKTDSGHHCHTASVAQPAQTEAPHASGHSCETQAPEKAKPAIISERLKRASAYFHGDINMIGKDILISILVASTIMVIVPIDFWNTLFLKSATPGIAVLSWNALVGIVVAMLAFVCSCGNILLAAALWHGGISFGGVIAFILSDLLTIPMLRVYKTYYGVKTTLYLFAVLSGCILLTALFLDYSFAALDLIPKNPTESLSMSPAEIGWNYRTLFNLCLIPIALGYYFWGKKQRNN